MKHYRLVWSAVFAVAMAVAALPGATHSVGAAPAVSYSRQARPLLAFYYMWYHLSDWCVPAKAGCNKSDRPAQPYNSSATTTIDRQIGEAAQAGVTGFAASWTGPGTEADTTFSRLLARSAAYQSKTGIDFQSALYIESDLIPQYKHTLYGALKFAIAHYTTNPHYFRWHGKPVFFIWPGSARDRNPSGWQSQWATLRRQLDPKHKLLWIVDSSRPYPNLMNVFDGFDAFSALYWCLPPFGTNIAGCNQTFRTGIDAYNNAGHAQELWDAPVQAGYNDTKERSPGYVLPRKNGVTYRASWRGAIASCPDWVTISTWNEWLEGSQIEPAQDYHNSYLSLTKKYSSMWRHTSCKT